MGLHILEGTQKKQNRYIMKGILQLLILLVVTMSCRNKVVYNDAIPEHESLKISSKILKEDRVINIWTPPNYDKGTDRYPVLYMPDGGIKEDFPHIANTLSKLVHDESIPPFILVGIENTERYRDLSGFSEVEADARYCPLTDGAKNFRAFIGNELITEIDKNYRTTSYKGIIGESLAGLFVMETYLLGSGMFDFYVAMDPSLWWNNHFLEQNAASLLSKISDKKTRLWFAGSGAEDISIHTNNLSKTLKESAPVSLTWKYSDEPNEKHSTIFRATKEKALIWAMSNKL